MISMKNYLLIIAFLLSASIRLEAQAIAVELDEALSIAGRHYLLLERDQQRIDQQQRLIKASIQQPLTEVFLAGQQLDLAGMGINGIGISQNLNWPGARSKRSAAQKQRAILANAVLEITRMELEKEVAIAYYELLFAKEALNLSRSQAELMAELVELAQLRFELGETGKIPVLSAQGKEKEAVLKLQQARHNSELAHVIFNNWLYTDTLYTTASSQLPAASGYLNWFVNGGHPAILQKQEEINLAESQIITERSWLLPQISTGMQLQMIDEDSPFYAYHLGMKVPLAQKSIRSRVEGARMEVEIKSKELEALREELENERRVLITAIKKEQETIDFLQNEMLPLAEEQIDASRRAYSQGAVDYQDYLQNLEQAIDTRWRHLGAKKNYHLLRLQLEFLSGRK